VFALVTIAVGETVFRSEVVWRPVALILAIVLVLGLPWRRIHAFAVTATTFGTLSALTAVELLLGTGAPVGLYTMLFVVLLPYALVRWASGIEIALGLTLVALTAALGISLDYTGVGDAIGGATVLLVPALLGGTARAVSAARSRELDQMRLREREQLARELHDTVAHHVSAIVIRAQAGQVVATQHPNAAVDALAVIEAEGVRTLAEMRSMVGALRHGEEPELSPHRGVADLELLARESADRLRVEVERTGDLDEVGPATSAALYRIAQESITNAVRHARHASRVDVRLSGLDGWVQLTVCDDGETSHAAPAGYGLVGMSERATLLGGSLEAGPNDGHGWTVRATLRKEGPAR
jgi:signal transduction histidine kinase